MPPKKKAAKAAAKPEKNAADEVTDPAATETAEPPKDVEQSSAGDSKPTANQANEDGKVSKDDGETENDTKDQAKSKTGSKKRKTQADPAEPSKASRRSARGTTKSEPSKQQLLNFLLSKEAEELVRPEDERKDVQERGDIRTYSSTALNPFEELMCAMILSRPISHRLGLRSIRTILNDPYNFTSAKVVKEAGDEKRHQALWDAKTQHKGKTADQIGILADVVLDKYTSDDDKEGSQISKALSNNNNDVDKALASLKENVKGLGNTGVDIFLRRVQWLWHAGFPYIDSRTKDSLRKIGLTQDAEELQELVEQYWSAFETERLAGDNEDAKKRRALVVILERVVGADLEDKIDQVLEAAVSSP